MDFLKRVIFIGKFDFHQVREEKHNRRMAKSKNHTGHKQTRKNHRNGIKRPMKGKTMSSRGVYQPFLKNSRYAAKNNQKWGQNQEKLIALRKVVAEKFPKKNK